MSTIILPTGVADSNGWLRLVDSTVVLGGEVFRHWHKKLLAIRGREMGRWHLSVSHTSRVPTWGELGFARDCLLPEDVWLVVGHPPRRYWLNLDSRVLHLWEFRDPELIAQWKEEGESMLIRNLPDHRQAGPVRWSRASSRPRSPRVPLTTSAITSTISGPLTWSMHSALGSARLTMGFPWASPFVLTAERVLMFALLVAVVCWIGVMLAPHDER